jgi:hypothetical protein
MGLADTASPPLGAENRAELDGMSRRGSERFAAR